MPGVWEGCRHSASHLSSCIFIEATESAVLWLHWLYCLTVWSHFETIFSVFSSYSFFAFHTSHFSASVRFSQGEWGRSAVTILFKGRQTTAAVEQLVCSLLTSNSLLDLIWSAKCEWWWAPGLRVCFCILPVGEQSKGRSLTGWILIKWSHASATAFLLLVTRFC